MDSAESERTHGMYGEALSGGSKQYTRNTTVSGVDAVAAKDAAHRTFDSAPVSVRGGCPATKAPSAVSWSCAEDAQDELQDDDAAAVARDAYGLLPSCDGADARYVEVANERAFSALQVREETSPFYGFRRPPFGPSSFTGSTAHQALREGLTSATLTPVRVSRAGTPLPSNSHTTPLHSTAYGSDCYNRLLSNALLGGSDGHTGVFSAPAPAVVLSKKMRAATPRCETVKAAEAVAQLPQPLSSASVRGVQEAAAAAGSAASFSGTEGSSAHRETMQWGKQRSVDSDSAASSLCSSLHPLTTGDGREVDEDEDEDVANGGRYAARTFFTAAHPGRCSRNESAQPRPVDSPSGATPSITSPLSYFQHAPSIWAGPNSPALRVRFPASEESAVVLSGAADSPTTNGSAAWPCAAARPSPPMRTAGVVPFFPSTSCSAAGAVAAVFPPASSPPSMEQANGPCCDTPLFAPSGPLHTMAQMVRSSCTPPSLYDTNNNDDEDGFPVDAPASPLPCSTHMARHPCFSTPSSSRRPFVLPASTACDNGQLQREGRVVRGGGETSGVGAGGYVTSRLCSGEDSPLPVFPSRQADRCDAVGDADRTPTRCAVASPLSLERGSALAGDAVRSSLRTSPASLLRHPATAHVLSTPVRHHDNAMYDFRSATNAAAAASSSSAVSCASLRGSTLLSAPSSAASPATRFPASPAAAVSLSPARASVRYGPAVTGSLDGAAARRHLSPYHELLLGGARGSAGRPAAAAAVAAAAAGQRHGATTRRDAFHFQRAMTASETSTDLLHSPFYWGSFGVLVAQVAEVWCVGKAQPFRIFPNSQDEAAAVARLFDGDAAVTAVASTALLSVAAWEEAGMTEDGEEGEETGPAVLAGISATAASPVSPVVAHAMAAARDVAYLAVGTTAGDVRVYAYGRCGLSAAGAVPLSLSTTAAHQTAGCAVRLRRYGTLLWTDRVREASRTSSEVGGFAMLDARAPSSSVSDGGDDRFAISVLRVVGSWLYIGDQAGHVSRYDLRTARFMSKVGEDAGTLPTPQPQMQPQQQPPAASRNSPAFAPRPAPRTVHGGGGTPSRVPVSPNPRMPVHHFARPGAAPCPPSSARAPAAPAAVAEDSAAAFFSTPLPQKQHQQEQLQSGTSFHFAVHTGEPVYSLEVTDSHGYLAVGTQTRLLVYRVAEMPRVVDDAVAVANVTPPPLSTPLSTPIARSSLAFLAGTPSPEASALRHTSMETTASPLVVVRDAPQPVRCFAWMLCDYEALHAGRSCRVWEDGRGAFAMADDGDDSLYDGTVADVAPVNGGGGASHGVSLSISSFFHIPAPTLVFAAARYAYPGEAAADGDDAALSAPPLKTDVQLYRVVTQSVTASCTLDYPVRVLRVVAGTTQIIVGTGSTGEWDSKSRTAIGGFTTPIPADIVMSAGTPRGGSLPSQVATLTPNPLHSATRRTGSDSNPTLSPVLSHAPAPGSVRRHSTPSAAAAAALRTLAGEPVRPYASGMWHTPHVSRTTPRLGSASAASAALSTGVRSGSATGTPDAAASLQQRPRGAAALPHPEDEHGFLFKLEVCPCAAGSCTTSSEGVASAVCLRIRGEIAVGEGESAVSGFLSPAQDQVSVLVQPTPAGSRQRGAANGMAVKVKVWQVTANVEGRSGMSGYTPALAPVAADPMESLR